MSIEVICPQCGMSYQMADELAGRKARCQACQGQVFIPPPDVTSGGSRVYRHAERQSEFELAIGDGQHIDRISSHIEAHIGPVESVFHEIVSDIVHVDVHWVAPTMERPVHTLVTSGMSERPMTVPNGLEALRFAELMLTLPPDWPMSVDAFHDECNYWPIRWMKMLARFPHEYETWLFYGHTIPNGDPPEAYADNTRMCCALIGPALSVPDDFLELDLGNGDTIHFFGLHFLYLEEMQHKLNQGMDSLMDRFVRNKIRAAIDPKRQNVCRKRWFLR